jgi:molybdopterin converting factor subunit 1
MTVRTDEAPDVHPGLRDYNSRKMTITVRLFAVLRDRIGVGNVSLDLPPGTTALAASRQLETRFPSIGPYLPKIAFAINQHYVSPATELHEGDELALIPPVSGG